MEEREYLGPDLQNRGCGSASLTTEPALAEIGTSSLLADGIEIQFPELFLNLDVLLASGDGLLHPFRFGKGVLLGPNLDEIGAIGFEILGECVRERERERKKRKRKGFVSLFYFFLF